MFSAFKNSCFSVIIVQPKHGFCSFAKRRVICNCRQSGVRCISVRPWSTASSATRGRRDGCSEAGRRAAAVPGPQGEVWKTAEWR